MSKTIFEKIVSNEIEASFVYRDEICVAFMDLNPINEGHVLVVPRIAVERLRDLESKIASHMFVVAQKVLRAIESSTIKIEGANLFLSDGMIAGQEVPHVHLHIVPRFSGDNVQISIGKKLEKVSRKDLDQAAEKIYMILNSPNN